MIFLFYCDDITQSYFFMCLFSIDIKIHSIANMCVVVCGFDIEHGFVSLVLVHVLMHFYAWLDFMVLNENICNCHGKNHASTFIYLYFMTLRFVECVSMQWSVKSHCAHVTVIAHAAKKEEKWTKKTARKEKEDEAENGEKNDVKE